MEGYEPTIAPSAVEMLSELQRGSTHVMEINVLMVEADEFQRTVLTQLFERANADNAGQVKFQVMLMESAAAALEHLECVEYVGRNQVGVQPARNDSPVQHR